MRAELVTPNAQNAPLQPLDLHAAIAEVLPQPELTPAAFPDTPLFASILNEHNLSYSPEQPELLAKAAAEREATVSDMWRETPLLMEVLERRPMVSPIEIDALTKTAQQTAIPANETVGWFTPQSRGNRRHFLFDTPPPVTLPPTMRLSRLSVWGLDNERTNPFEAQEPPLPYSNDLPDHLVTTVLEAPTAAPAKSASFVHTLHTKIAHGWRRLTTRSAKKSYVPAIPNW